VKFAQGARSSYLDWQKQRLRIRSGFREQEELSPSRCGGSGMSLARGLYLVGTRFRGAIPLTGLLMSYLKG